MFGRHRFKNLKRLREIANAFIKAELGYIIAQSGLKSKLSLTKQVRESEFKKPLESLPSRLRKAFDYLGGSFVKLGQLLSLRYDLLPKEYCDEFSKLQDDVKPVSFPAIKKTIEEEFKSPLKYIFKEFDKKPIASASVGQVHRAVLRNGHEVAVKVQRPGIEEVFQIDIELYYYLAKALIKHFPEIKQYDPIGIIKEFEKYTKKELDYIMEGKNIDIFYGNFKDSPIVTIPKVHWQYTTKRVLVMDFIHGKKIRDIKSFNALRSSRKKVVENVLDAVTTQILEHKFFHADPHPGNIFLLGDNKIAFLDFGIVGRITDDMELEIEDFIIGIVNKDIDLLIRSMIESGSINEQINMRALRADLADSLADYYNVSLKKIDISALFMTTFRIAQKYNIRLPLNYTLLAKSIMTLEGFSSKLYPDFNFVQFIKPKVQNLLKKRFGPKYIFDSVKDTALDFKDMLKNFPSDVSSLVRAIKYGTKINLEVDHNELQNFTFEINRSSNRLSFAILLAGLIMGSALVMDLNIPPMIGDIPLLVYVMYFFIFIISFSLIVSILRERHILKERR